MTTDPIAAIEYESLVYSRHLTALSGRSRRAKGVLEQSAYVLLNLLDIRESASIGELSAITGLDASTLNRQTAALVKSGYAQRIADPSGGMARKFTLTDQGVAALNEEREASVAVLSDLVSDWSPADRETFASLLARLNLEVEKRSGRHWPR